MVGMLNNITINTSLTNIQNANVVSKCHCSLRCAEEAQSNSKRVPQMMRSEKGKREKRRGGPTATGAKKEEDSGGGARAAHH